MNNLNIYHVGKLSVDTENQRVSVGKKIVHLTGREYRILECLVKHVGTVIPRKKLFEDIWGNLDTFSNVIDVHVKNLRKKIEAKNSIIIETIRGIGYRLKEV